MSGNGKKREDVDPIERSVGPRYRDLVGFQINRVWPTARRRLIGPFVFYDHMLPRDLAPGEGLDVPPHPHIGLATVTYLFDGELMHRDSLGTHQNIVPGDLNWMVAGAGITHSERTSDVDRARHSVLHGTQAWVALPRASEQAEPTFVHVAAKDIPQSECDGVQLRLLAGSGFGLRSPVPTDWPLHYAEAHLRAGSRLELRAELGQRAVYIVAGELGCAGKTLDAGRLFVLRDDINVTLQAASAAHVMLLGGAALPEERYVWWNFVASTPELIDAARQRWADDKFAKVPGDSGRMPMPKS